MDSHLTRLDEAAKISQQHQLKAEDREILLLSALCHDLGKVTTTQKLNGGWRSPGHSEAGVAISGQFLAKINCPKAYRSFVVRLVQEHLSYASFNEATPRIARRLKKRLLPANLQQLAWLIEADLGGRTPRPKSFPLVMTKLLSLADAQKEPPEPLLSGRDLLERGFKPGPEIGRLLRQVTDMQHQNLIKTRKQALYHLDRLIRQDQYGEIKK